MSYTPPVHHEPAFTKDLSRWDWLVWMVAISVVVLIRKDIGLRMLHRGYITGASLIVFLISLTQAAGFIQNCLMAYAGLIFVFGFGQMLKRRWDFSRMKKHHSFYLGTSPFAWKFLPEYFRRKRIMERVADPCFWMAFALILIPILGVMSLWLAFAACALAAVEGVAYKRMRDMQMDMVDGIIQSEFQGGVVEKIDDTPVRKGQAPQSSIATGLGDDIARKIAEKRRNQ